MQTVIYSMGEKIARIGLFKSPFVTCFCDAQSRGVTKSIFQILGYTHSV